MCPFSVQGTGAGVKSDPDFGNSQRHDETYYQQFVVQYSRSADGGKHVMWVMADGQ